MRAAHSRPVLSLVGLSLGLCACAGGAAPATTLAVSCPQALLGLDQIGRSGFEVQDAPHLLQDSAPDAPPSWPGGRPRSAAEVRYFRPVRDLATSNGPIDITARATCYGDTGTASRALWALGAAQDRSPGELPLSTDPLGDEAHADLRRARTQDRTPLAQLTLRWRLSTVVNTLTVRGREVSFGLGDVLALGARQDENELAITTPAPPSPLSTTSPPSPSTSAVPAATGGIPPTPS